MKTIILTFLLCVTQSVFAQNITSALIGHAFTDNNTIAVYFNIHTTAAVQSIPDSTIDVTLSDISNNIHIPVTNYKLISQVKERIGCDSTSDTYMHQYTASVNLKDAAFSALSASCVLRGELVVSNRIGGSTSADGHNQPIYVYDEFELCSKTLSNRNTHRTVSNGMFYSCLNQPSAQDIGAFDIAEFDSLSFQLVTPMIDRNTNTTFKSGLSASKPIDVKASTQFSFDEKLGEFTFQPSDTNQNMASVSIKTIEWRKDASGVDFIVGTSMREVLIVIDRCQSNNSPVILGKKIFEVCEGEQICFVIETLDKVKIQPPPMPSPKQDSVTIKWNRGIPGATFTVLNKKDLHQSARFCWTPKLGEANSLPYTFLVTARDDFCPTNGITNAPFSVYVTPKPQVNLKVSRITDSSFATHVTVPTGHDINKYTISHALLDVSLNPLPTTDGRFLSSATNESNQVFDTIVVYKTGKFVLDLQAENALVSNCAAHLQETYNFHPLSVVDLKTNIMNLYPNPTSGMVNLEYVVNQVEVRNSIGELIWFSDETDEVDLTTLPSGIYTVSGLFNDILYTGKVIKH